MTARIALAALCICAISLNAEASTITFSADRDTALLGDVVQNSNFGGAGDVFVGNFFGVDERAILSFDVSALSGEFFSIDSITLRLVHHGDVSSLNTLTHEVFAISAANRDWTEGSANDLGSGTVTGDSTWNERHRGTTPGVNGTAWAGSAGLSTSGTDYDATLLASRVFTASPDNLPDDGDVVDFTFTGSSSALTSLINSWLVDNVANSQPNPGLVVFDPNFASLNHGERTIFHSRESTSVASRPALLVSFTPIPEPSTALLVALGLVSAAGFSRRKPDSSI